MNKRSMLLNLTSSIYKNLKRLPLATLSYLQRLEIRNINPCKIKIGAGSQRNISEFSRVPRYKKGHSKKASKSLISSSFWFIPQPVRLELEGRAAGTVEADQGEGETQALDSTITEPPTAINQSTINLSTFNNQRANTTKTCMVVVALPNGGV